MTYQDEHKEMVEFLKSDPDNRFYASLLRNIERWGGLTVGQEQAAYRNLQQAKARAARPDSVKPAPVGRVNGQVFRVENIKYDSFLVNGYMVDQTKMTACHIEDGYKIYVTVPKAIEFDLEIGNKVSMNVTLTPSKNDDCFAFGKRPAKAEIVA